MDIQWFSKNTQGVATIYETNITLNTVACDFLKDAYATLIGYDKDNDILLIKSLNREESCMPKYNENDLHRVTIKSSYGRINGKGIIRNITQFFPLDFTRKNMFKFLCDWDASQRILKVYLKKEVF